MNSEDLKDSEQQVRRREVAGASVQAFNAIPDTRPPVNKPRLLFVEDEAVVREHLAQQLANEYEVETAADGELALKAVLRRRPDVIVTDLLMPSIDGVELVRTLRNTPSTATIPILMTSGRAPDELRLEGFELGADAFLSKPYTELELRVRLSSLVRTTRLRVDVAAAEARRRIEHEALADRAALLESISDAFYAVDREWRFTYVNQRALDYFGVTRGSVIGRVLWDVLPVGKGTRIEEEYRSVSERRRPAHFEMVSPHSSKWIEFHVYPTPEGIAVHFRDISDRKRAEAALRELTATLEQRVQAAIAERDRAWNNTQDLLLVLDTSGTLKASNPAWRTLLGWDPSEIIGRPYLDFIHPEDHERGRQALVGSTEHAIPQFDTRILAKDGTYRHIAWVAAAEENQIYASGRDVTIEKEAVEALRQATARTRTIFETSYQYQGYIDPNGVLLDSNRTSLAGIDSELSDVVGLFFWDTPWFTSTPGAASLIKADVARVLAGESVQRELTLELAVGRRAFDFSMRPVFDDNGKVIGVVPEAMDVTDRKSNAEQLSHMQKLETIGQLTGNVAHDFNNLLTPIVGALDLLHRKYNIDARAQKLTAGAIQSAERARVLVQKLLAFARKQHLEARAVSVGVLLDSFSELLRRSIGPRIHVAIHIQEGLPAAHVDPNQLELALLNLALNARDAMLEGGDLKITARTETVRDHHRLRAGEYVNLSVSDTGAGMDATTLARAVEPFYTTKPAGQGTGPRAVNGARSRSAVRWRTPLNE